MAANSKLNFRLEDLNTSADILYNKLKRSHNKSKVFCWLAIKFIKEQKKAVTCKELSDGLPGMDDFSYSFQVLESFCKLGVLKKINRPGNRVMYTILDLSIFNDRKGYLDLAKKTIGIKK